MIAIIYVDEVRYCPFLKNYTRILDENRIHYELILWNRNGLVDKEENYHVFVKESVKKRNPFYKIDDFYQFSRFAKKIIKSEKYEKLIVLTTMSAICIRSTLMTDYRNKYIFDYRDASYEYLYPFKSLLKQIVENSFFTCISSKGFLEILPKNLNYIIAHNISNQYQNIETEFQLRIKKEVFNVVYIGVLRETKFMKHLIDIFSNDNRFVFTIHGGGENLEILQRYSDQFDNVVLTGSYFETDKEKLIKTADIICYNYRSNFENDFALANKFYDGLIYRIPLLGNISTFSGRLISEKGLGISLALSDNDFKNKLYTYLMNFDKLEYMKNVERFFAEILTENRLYSQSVYNFLELEFSNKKSSELI